jgi:hypothetical protein
MREALHIFRKDVRHLWPGILLVLGMASLECLMNAAFVTLNPFQPVVALLWLLSCAYLVTSAIQEERVPGHEQYWLTRPIDRGQLVLAKVLFLVVFLGLPELALQSVALAVNGASPLHHVGGLFSMGFLFSIAIGLAIAALAAVTESLVQFLYAVLPLAGIEIAASVLSGPRKWRWDDSAMGTVVLAAAVIVLAVQYRRRETIWARGILAAAILAATAAPFRNPSHFPSSSMIRISPGPPARPSNQFHAGIAIPIVVTGIPAGARIVSERMAATISARGGKSWQSGWSTNSNIAARNPLEDERAIRADGPGWAYLAVDRAFYQAVKDDPVEVHASIAVTLLGERQSALLAFPGKTKKLPGDGLCTVDPGPFRNLAANCAWPLGNPARAYITAGSLESLLTPAASYGLWHRAATVFSPPPEPRELRLETWQAIDHFQSDLYWHSIRLSDYEQSPLHSR